MIDDPKNRYPYISTSSWWALRAKFQKSPPRGKVAEDYLTAVLPKLNARSAQVLLAELKLVGLVTFEGSITELGDRWRLDEKYSVVCKEIVETIYPQGLRDVSPPSDPDREIARNWFMGQGYGKGTAQNLAGFYILLCEGDPKPQSVISLGQKSAGKTKASTKKAGPNTTRTPRATPTTSRATSVEMQIEPFNPSIHIDIQIHISPDTTSDQIDEIFASMMRHVYPRTSK